MLLNLKMTLLYPLSEPYIFVQKRSVSGILVCCWLVVIWTGSIDRIEAGSNEPRLGSIDRIDPGS